MTMVDRATSCVLQYHVGHHRSEVVLQALLDAAPQAERYYSDGMPAYKALFYYPGRHFSMRDKSQTYRVEGMNAELRHYLSRLVRRSRCYSRCIKALDRAVKLFVYAWNRRQLYKQRYPKYKKRYLIDFAYPPC